MKLLAEHVLQNCSCKVSALSTRWSSEKCSVQVLLLLPQVPVQTLSQRLEPVGDLVPSTHTWHRVYGRGHPQTVNTWNESLIDQFQLDEKQFNNNANVFTA